MLCFTGGINNAQTVAKITAEKETANQNDRSFYALSRNNNNKSCDFGDFRLLPHVVEVFTLLGCYIAQVSSLLLSWSTCQSHLQGFSRPTSLNCLTLEDGIDRLS